MPHREHEAMLGRGGHIRVPRSESATIDGVITLITNGEYREAINLLRRLRDQVAQGYHRNPEFRAGMAKQLLGDDVHTVKYRHAKDGKHYQHDFNGDVLVYAVQRGDKKDLLLTHKDGSPLWDEF